MNRTRLTDILTVLVTCMAILLGGARLWEIAFPPPDPNEPVELANWQDFTSARHHRGPRGAPITIIEFSDFQCPFCRAAQEDLRALEVQYPSMIRRGFRHFPLTALHPEALDAALASECAAQQNRFWPMAEALSATQHQIGDRSWSEWAAQVGVADLLVFDECMNGRESLAAIRRDSLAAEALELLGTPGIIVNDRLFRSSPGLDRLVEAVERILTGEAGDA